MADTTLSNTVVEIEGAGQLAACRHHAVLLSGGGYALALTGAGGGFSSFNGQAVTRWTADGTRDCDGFPIYVRDQETGRYWSIGLQPTLGNPEHYAARLFPGHAEIERVQEDIRCRMEVWVSPDGVELRRCSLTNLGSRSRRLELTSYLEFVLNSAEADAAHPAFSKLFVETCFDTDLRAILAKRRASQRNKAAVHAAHFLAGIEGSDSQEPIEFETDRVRFIGRGRGRARPIALESATRLSGTQGSVLDPIGSLRRFVNLAPGGSVEVTFALSAALSVEELRDAVVRYSDPGAVSDSLAAADESGTELWHRLGLSSEDASRVPQLVAMSLYGWRRNSPRESGCEAAAYLSNGHLEPAIAEELLDGRPLLLATVCSHDDLAALPSLFAATELLRRNRPATCLAVLTQPNDRESESLWASSNSMVRESLARFQGDGYEGGIVLLDARQLTGEWIDRIKCSAKAVFEGDEIRHLGLAESKTPETAVPISDGDRYQPASCCSNAQLASLGGFRELQFFNGYGGFSAEGREYVIRIEPDDNGGLKLPPMPWVNVVANEQAGFIATETGAGYTWVGNSRLNRLTPWSNDPVSDPHGEAFYLRDEDARVFWSPMPGPAPGGAYEVSHGFGYSRCEHRSNGLAQQVLQFVPRCDPMKITHVRITNESDQKRRLSLFAYQQWVLGGDAAATKHQIQTWCDHAAGAVFASNHHRADYGGAVAFSCAVPFTSARGLACSADREAFIGRYGSASSPRALRQDELLLGTQNRGPDPCVALQLCIELEPGQTFDGVFLLGEADSQSDVQETLGRYQSAVDVDRALEEVRRYWSDLTSTIEIETPSRAINLLTGTWLPYQNLACRIWGRSAYYQSGGAYGFRDQLQDSSAFVFHKPELTRKQIVLHASHQFVEGDVLHWWHPPRSLGIRTRFSDDLLWLPYIADYYVQTTGDEALWDQQVPFVAGPALEGGVQEAPLTPVPSGTSGTVLEHCFRSIDSSLTKGAHGLPLMGCGDWNDGMSRIGADGLGESVWLGFFLYHILGKFIPICEERGFTERARRYSDFQLQLYEALNSEGWDGEWYRRAFFGDGTPVGSAQSDECQRDALAQAWSVLSGAAPPDRADKAVRAVEEFLVCEEGGLIRLLAPAFNKMGHDPGYIKDYLPGIRENGGQYTHGVLWFIRAMAELGHGTRAVQLLEMISPINHARTPEEVAVYQTEPYVVAADVYGEPPHVGRGGWTWYTGSAGWMFRVVVESVLGLGVEAGKTLVLDPRIPAAWSSYRLRYRLPDRTTVYEVEVENPDGKEMGVGAATLDGRPVDIEEGAARIPITADGQVHQVVVRLGLALGER